MVDVQTQNTANNSNKNNGNNIKKSNDEQEDDWVTSKPKPIEETREEIMARKRATQKRNHSFNNYLAPTSLKAMKDQIHSKKTEIAAPPPLQDLGDDRQIVKKHGGGYKIKRKHRKGLDILEPIPRSPSEHKWSSPPVITGVSGRGLFCFIYPCTQIIVFL